MSLYRESNLLNHLNTTTPNLIEAQINRNNCYSWLIHKQHFQIITHHVIGNQFMSLCNEFHLLTTKYTPNSHLIWVKTDET